MACRACHHNATDGGLSTTIAPAPFIQPTALLIFIFLPNVQSSVQMEATYGAKVDRYMYLFNKKSTSMLSGKIVL